MAKEIVADIFETVGNTPLMKLSKLFGASLASVYAKLEMFNPTGSVKARTALALIRDGEKRGVLQTGGMIVEPTSGNTGIALAAFGAVLGYRVILTMPKTMSAERRSLLSAYGAEIVLTDDMPSAILKAKEICAENKNAYMPSQFDNPANAEIHFTTTGPEIWNQTNGSIDVLIAGAGTGGTVTGAGRYLKQMNPSIEIIAVEPEESKVLSGGKAGPHLIQGIGAGFVPGVLDMSVVDRVIPVKGTDALQMCRRLALSEGILAGISSGAALSAAVQSVFSESKNIVVILPDTGDRYLSVPDYLNFNKYSDNKA